MDGFEKLWRHGTASDGIATLARVDSTVVLAQALHPSLVAS